MDRGGERPVLASLFPRVAGVMAIKRRWFWTGLLVLMLASAGVALFALQQYIAGQMSVQLAAQYGAEVEIDSSSVTWSGTSLHGVRLFEVGAPRRAWLEIAKLETDLALGDILRGRRVPRTLTLHSPRIHLRLDERGGLATRLPQGASLNTQLPESISIAEGRLELEQARRPEFALGGIAAALKSAGESFNITGQARDPSWGEWKAGGTANVKQTSAAVQLSTAECRITPELVRTLPKFGLELARQIETTGPVRAKADLRYTPGEPLSYRAEFSSQALNLRLAALDLVCQASAAEATVTPGLVHVSRLQGETAGGRISGQGDFKFDADPLKLDLSLDFARLSLAKLAERTELRGQLEGKLSGRGQASVELSDEWRVTTGQGTAEIASPLVAGLPMGPIEIALAPPNQNDANLPAPADAPPAAGGLKLPNQTLTVSLSFDRLELKEIVQRLSHATGRPAIELPPLPVSGPVSGKAQVDVPLGAWQDMRSYRARGELTSPALQAGPLKLESAAATLDYSAGILRADPIQAQIMAAESQVKDRAPGEFNAKLTAVLAPLGQLQVSGTAIGAPLEPLLSQAGIAGQGQLSVGFAFAAPVEKLAEPVQWKATGQLAARLEIEKQPLDAAGDFAIDQGTLRVAAAKGSAAGTAWTASGQAQLAAPFPFTADVQVDDANIQSLLAATKVTDLPAVAGRLSTSGHVSGTLLPAKIAAAGRAELRGGKIDGLAIDDATLGWQADEKQFQIRDLVAHALGAELRGAGSVALDRTAASRFEGQVHGINLDAAARQLGVEHGLATGHVSAKIKVSLQDRRAAPVGQVEFQSDDLKLQGVAVEDAAGKIAVDKHHVSYSAAGQLLDARLDLQGDIPLAPAVAGLPPAPGQGRLQIHGARLSRAWRLFRRSAPAQELQGLVDFDIAFNHDRLSLPASGKGQLIISDLAFGSQRLSGKLQSDVLLSRELVRFTNLTARADGGLIRGEAMLDLLHNERSQFTARVERVNAEWLLQPWPEVAARIRGPIDLVVTGRGGRSLHGSGTLAFAGTQLQGLDLVDAQIPFQWLYRVDSGAAHLEVPETSIPFAHGRLTARTTIDWDGTLSTDGHVQVSAVELQALGRSSSNLTTLGNGRITGQARFNGRQMRSLDDLAATFTAKFTRSQAFQLPVLRELARFVIPGQSLNVTFQEGNVRGRLARGVVHLQQFTLSGTGSRLLVSGTVSTAGRLNLDVVSAPRTNLVEPLLQRYLAVPVLAANPLTLPLFLRANAGITNRMIFLHVAGTVRNPVIQVQAVPQLGQEALFYFAGSTGLVLPTTGNP